MKHTTGIKLKRVIGMVLMAPMCLFLLAQFTALWLLGLFGSYFLFEIIYYSVSPRLYGLLLLIAAICVGVGFVIAFVIPYEEQR